MPGTGARNGCQGRVPGTGARDGCQGRDEYRGQLLVTVTRDGYRDGYREGYQGRGAGVF